MSVVELTQVTPVAATPPMVTAKPDPATNPVPVIVTTVPPAVMPTLGAIDVTAGATGTAYVNAAAAVPDNVLGFVTETATAGPAAPAGVTAVNDVELTQVTLVAADPPMVTVAPVMKPVPVIVTDVPPKVEPELGESETAVGGTTAYV